MKVSELIEKLKDLPQDYSLSCSIPDYYCDCKIPYWSEAIEIEVLPHSKAIRINGADKDND